MFNLLYNSFMFLKLAKGQSVALHRADLNAGYLLVYLNLTACVAIIYLKFFILNPSLFKKKENIGKYMQGK